MRGVCGTCGRDAEATGENEGYSDCCNDRIEYGIEAETTRQRVKLEKIEDEQGGWTDEVRIEALDGLEFGRSLHEVAVIAQNRMQS